MAVSKRAEGEVSAGRRLHFLLLVPLEGPAIQISRRLETEKEGLVILPDPQGDARVCENAVLGVEIDAFRAAGRRIPAAAEQRERKGGVECVPVSQKLQLPLGPRCRRRLSPE